MKLANPGWCTVKRNRWFLITVLTAALALCLAVSAAVLSHGQEREQANPEVDKVFADLETTGSPGCALGVFRNGAVLYAKGYGLASVELNVPITPQTVFDIGSTSKQFTASSILLLEQEGKLSLNDDVRKYIPELPDYGHTITILNLLNHTSGLRDYLGLLSFAGVSGDSVTTDDDALALLIRQKHLNFTPGSKWEYSNSGYFLLAVIVKRVGGTSLREFALRNIFQPLGMAHTTFRDDHTMLIPQRALAYDPGEKGSYKLDVSYYEQLGDGAVHTSVEDLGKWDENFYSGQVGGRRLLEEIQEQGKLSNGKQLEYAKALFIGSYRGLRTVRHGGAWGGYRAELLRFPDQHFSVACLCNLSNANPERRAEQVAGIYLRDQMKPEERAAQAVEAKQPAAALSPAQMAAIAGTYRNPAEGNVARVKAAKGALHIELYGSTFGLHALSPTEFVPVGFPADVKLSFDPTATNPVMKVSGDKMLAADYDKIREFTPSAGQLAAYAGDYKSEELAVVYRLRVVKGKLTLAEISDVAGMPRTGMSPPQDLEPTITDEFAISAQGSTVHFSRNGNAPAMGFELGAGRTRGISFSRIPNLPNPL